MCTYPSRMTLMSFFPFCRCLKPDGTPEGRVRRRRARVGEPQDLAEPVALLQFDGDVGDRHRTAAQADALDALIVAEHALRDRALVANLAEHELNLADPAPAALAADAVPQSSPSQGFEHGLRLRGVDLQPVGKDRYLRHMVPAFPRSSGSCHRRGTDQHR